jgi:hypothetical protein
MAQIGIECASGGGFLKEGHWDEEERGKEDGLNDIAETSENATGESG